MDLKYYTILFFILIFTVNISAIKNNSEIIIDQRQTGKFNINLSIKDVSIIEFGDSKDDLNDGGDYYYDDSDLTVKPWFQMSTTKATKTTTKSTTIEANDNFTTPIIYVTPIKEIINSTEKTKPTNTSNNILGNSMNVTEINNITLFENISSTESLDLPIEKPLFLNKNVNEIPLKIIMEPVLIPRIRSAGSNKLLFNHNTNKDSRVFRLNTTPKYINRNNKRYKAKSVKFFEKLLNLLVAMPFNNVDAE